MHVSVTFIMCENRVCQACHTNCVSQDYLVELRTRLARLCYELCNSGRTRGIPVNCAIYTALLQRPHKCANYSTWKNRLHTNLCFAHFLQLLKYAKTRCIKIATKNCVAPEYLVELRKRLDRVCQQLCNSGRTWEVPMKMCNS